MNICNKCWNKLKNENIKQLFPLTDFSWIKTKTKIIEYFCSKKCKTIFNKYRQEYTTPALAELDESMNYCLYFYRKDGNNWVYIKDWFNYPVSWLWDYKSFNINWAKEFKEHYIKHFGNFNRFVLHTRYINN